MTQKQLLLAGDACRWVINLDVSALGVFFVKICLRYFVYLVTSNAGNIKLSKDNSVGYYVWCG